MMILLLALTAAATAAVIHGTHGHAHHHRDIDPSLPLPTLLPQLNTYTADPSYIQHVLTHHNVHRSNHSASSLIWSDSLAASAQKLAQRCQFMHDLQIDGGGYGQNIASGMTAANVSAVITELWYNNEIGDYTDLYGVANPGGGRWGHFTQLVWKDTGAVGCWTEHCPNGVEFSWGTYDYTVCNYGAQGNVAGQYADNVGVPLGMAAVGWGYAA